MKLESLKCIKELTIGPTKVEKKRLVTPYIVKINNNSVAENKLIYRFEEPVFDPANQYSANLAAMIGAQVALNYGLFCEQIIFEDKFDTADQQFISDMATNTAREIYVKKFLQPNPFLVGDAKHIQLEKRENYLQSELIFPNHSKINTEKQIQPDKQKIAILSSGGKDSLVSYGLLNELGYDTYPIFINESGRHWYTALNAFRYFRENIPNTRRVWTNCDRIFNWMLRQLSFIRKDYNSIRSDEYPVRLWTVAVFLFGALPHLHKSKVGSLVIGDEFDTTRRTNFKGITHYDGLYDQSRYFDNALTRYFFRKKWQVSQFSILRPISELLIEKILVERYPDLQKNQVSCHAAHIDGDHVYPCGNCEKCRRIIGMLSAIGADPKNCGYTQKQINNNLKNISIKKVHQESAGVKQMLFMLSEKGIIEKNKMSKSKITPQPKILKVRIDPERSPVADIPKNIRIPLYKIILEHAQGSTKRAGRIWIDFDLLNDQSLYEPYIFEQKRDPGEKNKNSYQQKYMLGELSWPDARDRFKEVDIALLPVGAIEQHGPHLPLDTDAFDAGYLAEKVAEACTDPKPLVLPLIAYGVSYHHEDFPGTISINNDTLTKLVYDIGISAARNGITKLVIINGHGGNIPSLKFAAQMINRDAHIFTTVDSGETSDVDLDKICETPNDVHAGEIETSTALFNRPNLVNMKLAKKFIPKFSSQYLDFSAKRSIEWFARTSKISKTGILGDPTKASAEKGKKMWEIMITNLVELVEHIKGLTLNEIYEKRY